MADLIDRQEAIEAIRNMCEGCDSTYCGECRVSFPGREDCEKVLEGLPPVQPDARLKKIADLVDGTIDHFDRDDAMDLLYQIKEVLKDGLY